MNKEEVFALWEEARELLARREETSSPMALAFLTYLVPQSLDDNQMIFATRLEHAKDWVERRYIQYIEDAFLVLLGSRREVSIVVDENAGAIPATTPTGASSSLTTTPTGIAASTTTSATTPAVAMNTPATAVNAVVAPTTVITQSVSQAEAFSSQSVAQPVLITPVAQPAPLTQAVPPVSSSVPAQSISSSPVSATPTAQAVLPIQSTLSAPTSPASLAGEGAVSGSAIFSIFSQDNDYPPVQDPAQGLKTFSNFVVGSSNDYAYSAAMRVAESPGQYFNPLFIYGRSGLGKTHLLLAIKNYINTYQSDKRVVYAPTSEFVNDFTGAMAGDRDLTSFKRKYHTCDVLLLDDVQHLEGKEGTSDALFEIFNMFIDRKKQIVLSADRSPVEINLDERFTSRFAGGVTVDIQPPNYEMKVAIFMNYKHYFCSHINAMDIDIPDEVVQHIIELSGSNIRELEGAVSSIVGNIAFRPPEKRSIPITPEEAEAIVGKVFFHKDTRRVDIQVIQQAVEAYYRVSHDDLLSDKRSKNISHPRQVAMYLSRRLTPKSFPEIGKSFGNKDHTTAMYACKNIQAKLVSDMSVKTEVERIAEMITT
ncbi:MAG: chromosomal replication initiator protein DnaA [Coriobacteriales bacterium]|jgi:chromosomal replication initiator protein|nr:chromosomal replication initiator protein DnaA [Coriobacteriales bacterium]